MDQLINISILWMKSSKIIRFMIDPNDEITANARASSSCASRRMADAHLFGTFLRLLGLLFKAGVLGVFISPCTRSDGDVHPALA